jgi:hypothetical protein
MNRHRHWRTLSILSILLLLYGCTSATYVPRIEIQNPTDYDLSVDVKGDGDAARLQLGIVKKGRETVTEQVIDLGEDWIFTFGYLGQEAGSVSLKRSELESARWKVVIPEEIGNRLKEKGVPASY